MLCGILWCVAARFGDGCFRGVNYLYLNIGIGLLKFVVKGVFFGCYWIVLLDDVMIDVVIGGVGVAIGVAIDVASGRRRARVFLKFIVYVYFVVDFFCVDVFFGVDD